MKIIIYSLIVFLFTNCNNRKESVSKKDTKAKDSVQSNIVLTKVSKSKAEMDDDHADTLFKKSKLFKINGVNCFWELTLFLNKGEKGGTGKLELRNQKNGKIILNKDEDYYYLENLSGGDWQVNEDIIKDANFDGYKDIVLYNRGASGSAGEFSDIYLFKPAKKTFEKSKALSGYNIAIDTITKTVSFYARNGAAYNVSGSIYFGRHGKIKYEEITESETIDNKSPLFKITYRKIINDKVVKTTIDTVTDY
jgi:hypothetical protein